MTTPNGTLKLIEDVLARSLPWYPKVLAARILMALDKASLVVVRREAGK